MDLSKETMRGNGRAQEERQIRSDNFGGLNTTASPLNTPYEDSPYLRNALIDISGSVEKRKGTRLIYRNTSSSDGNSLNSFTTGLQYNYVVAKQGRDILIFESYFDVVTLLIQKSNVWSSLAAAVTPSVVATSEVQPRLIFCTGTNRPVQLSFTETQITATGSGSSVTLTGTKANTYRYATSNSCVAFVNRVRVPGATFSWSTGNFTVGGLSVVAGDVVDVCLITWQWWAEANTWTGDRFFKISNRFNVSAADKNVQVPTNLITDLDSVELSTNTYNVIAYKFGTRTTDYTFSVSSQPTTENQYSFSDGTIYNAGANIFLTSTPNFVTFGALQSGGAPSAVYFNRRRKIKFRNGINMNPSEVDVFVDGVKRVQITSAGSGADVVYKNYWMYNTTFPGIVDGSTITTGDAVTFEAGTLGLPATARVEVADNKPAHIGSAARNEHFDYRDGNYVMAFGLGSYADYDAGYYPSVVSLYQNRLVFAGFANRPLSVLFSELGDSTVPGKYYASYSITNDNTLNTSAFDVVVNSRPDDRVTALVEWQSSLFVLTRYSCFRVSGQGTTPLSPTGRFVTFVSNTGCVNPNAWARTDFSVLYLSDTGLYDLVPIVENGEYEVRERSVKIRSEFGVTKDPRYEDLAWVRYDSDKRLVFIGMPAEEETHTTRDLLVYNTYRESWSKWDTPGGFNAWSASNFVDRGNGTRFGMVCCLTRDGSRNPTDFVFIRFDDFLYLDYCQRKTHNGTGYFVPTPPKIFHTVNVNQRHYALGYTNTKQLNAFESIPVSESDELTVFAGSTLLSVGVDYVKEESGYIYLLKSLPTGTVLTLTLGGTSSLPSYFVVFVNSLKVNSPSVSSNSFTLTATNGDVVDWGVAYLSAYTSPMFFYDSLADYKRTQHAYVFFDNRSALMTYQAADAVNSQDVSALTDGYRQQINCNLAIMYNAAADTKPTYDIFGFDQLTWDDSVFDVSTPYDQYSPYQSVKVPVTGVGYGFQLWVWCWSEDYFKLSGYQITSNTKGKRYTGSKY